MSGSYTGFPIANVAVLVWFARRFSKEVRLTDDTPMEHVEVNTLAAGSL